MSVKNKVINLSVIALICLVYLCVTTMGIIMMLPNNSAEKLNAISNFEIVDNLADGNGKKAKVVILAGQSNADGVASKNYLKANVGNAKYQIYENGFDNVYINYFNSNGTNFSNGFEKTAVGCGFTKDYFGPELGIAEKLNELYVDEQFFIIKYSWGGSNLHTQWRSPSSSGKTGELYTAFKNFVNANLHYLILKNYDIEISAVCWMQGESDSFNIIDAHKYKNNLLNFILDVRKDFDKYKADGGIKFIDAYIANAEIWKHHKIVNTAKSIVAKSSKLNYCVDTISNNLTRKEPIENPDLAHYDSLSQIKLGHLFAEKI